MAIISQETWDNMPCDEKQRLQTEYAGAMVNSKENITVQVYERIFGKENLQPKSKIRTWEDIEEQSLIDETLEERLGALSYWNTETKAICDKCSATLKIAKLIELGYGGMVTEEEWKDNGSDKGFYGLWANSQGKIECTLVYDSKEFVAFHTKQQAEEFMSYPENVELVKQYNMI